MSAFILEFFTESDVKFTNNESGLQRAEVLRQINLCAWRESTQLSAHVEHALEGCS
jgi:hypothetical protein